MLYVGRANTSITTVVSIVIRDRGSKITRELLKEPKFAKSGSVVGRVLPHSPSNVRKVVCV